MSGWNPAAVGIMNSMTNQGLLLMKMRMLALGKHYDIMDKDEHLLATMSLDAKQNMTGAVVGTAVASIAGDYIGRLAKRSLAYTYDVMDAGGNLAFQIRKGSGGNTAQFTVVDPITGVNAGTIDMKRSLFGGLKAHWMAPSGQPLMVTKGNIIRRKYTITDTSGKE